MEKNRKGSKYSDQKKVKMVVLLMEQTLTIYQYLYQEKFPIGGNSGGTGGRTRDRNAQSEVMKFMNTLKEVLTNGVDVNDAGVIHPCSFPKFHYLKHIYPMILKYGSARNFDGGPSESNHKQLSKKPGNRTQRRLDTFDEQTCQNLADQIVLEKACKSAEVFVGKGSGSFLYERNEIEERQDEEEKGEESIYVHSHSSNFVLEVVEGDTNTNGGEGEDSILTVKWKSSQVKPVFTFDRKVLDFVKKKLNSMI